MSTAKILKYSNLVFTIIWLILVVPSLLWWKNSILWVILISLWANIVGHFGAYIAARAELTQQTGHNLTRADKIWLLTHFSKNEIIDFPSDEEVANGWD